MASAKNIIVKEAIRCGNGSAEWVGEWESRIEGVHRECEEEIKSKISGIVLRDEEKDRWRWGKGEYSVKDAYHEIMKRKKFQTEANINMAAAWNSLVPQKISVLVWRIWQNRIHSRDNLVKRGILVDSQNSCPFGCGTEENVAHIFFECPSAVATWSEVYAVVVELFGTGLSSSGSLLCGQFGK
ncbi:uncharacterized protein LOC131613839 [Vicia villosa]|uniref:uncharacterized protein LOC131613839 n=1 Tax=Vicia villosa TaxID=3911 RepID=UPI00273A97A4|nr:uncharacterized protein LOC131613839 [Vicia villosa]